MQNFSKTIFLIESLLLSISIKMILRLQKIFVQQKTLSDK
jgi:hypothetical protein